MTDSPQRANDLPPLSDLRALRFDGREALVRVIEQSAYGSLPQAVASLAAFSNPKTVAQTAGRNMFRVVRARLSTLSVRGSYADAKDGAGRVMLDDNRSPAVAFEWSHSIRSRPDVQVNHIWQLSQEVSAYTSLANLCLTPSFLAKLTDTHEETRALLRYRAYDLFGYWPLKEHPPTKPELYDSLQWAEPLPPVSNLEVVLREAMRTKRKDRVVTSARELGWVFSDYKPDPTI